MWWKAAESDLCLGWLGCCVPSALERVGDIFLDVEVASAVRGEVDVLHHEEPLRLLGIEAPCKPAFHGQCRSSSQRIDRYTN